MTSKKEIKEKAQEMQKELESRGLTHNDKFQKLHAAKKILCRKGHWNCFLERLIMKIPIECEACKLLVDKYVHGIEVDHPAVQDQPPAVLEPRARGRPRRGDTVDPQFLQKFIEAKRAHIYQVTPKSELEFEYFCIPCQKSIPFFRNSLTYMTKHERVSQSHRKGLELLNIDIHTFEHQNNKQERKPCTGICVNGLSGASCGKMAMLMESLQTWCAAGMPYVSSSNKSLPVENCFWKLDGDQFICRHVKCSGTPSIDGCHVCKALFQDDKMATEIAKWAYKIDLGVLANSCAYWTESDRQKHIAEMMNKDYRKTGMAGSDLEETLCMSSRQIVLNVRKSWESVPRSRRNGSYDAFVNLHIAGLADYAAQEDAPEKEIFANMVSKYRNALEQGSCIEEAPWPHTVYFKQRLRDESNLKVWVT